ncbi:phospholipase [Halochromatium glycolicum]|uniref:Phospholipase A1 n=2 Tax=Halochromatium glycolicum TaxID=85075 RepID=A0AAJ0U3V3_9GAMM|nr:phospholipase [Halochromatium glycolicum]
MPLLLLLPALLTASPVAVSAAPGLQSCAAINDAQRRLACYDRISGRSPALPGALSTGSEPAAASRQPISAPAAVSTGADFERSVPASAPVPAAMSMLERAWSFNPDSDRYLIKLFNPNYLAPVRYQSRTNDRPFSPVFSALETPESEVDNIEAAFQISFKTRVWANDDRRFGLWFAYTQQSFWQVYNDENSSPFRDTNYKPELMVAWQPQLSVGGFELGLLGLGYTHESNGRADPISRSWDRLIARIGLERGDFALLLRPWIRIDDEGSDEDNPDITDYYGYGDITAVYKWRGNSFTLMARGNPGESKGAVRATWMTPKLVGPLRGYLVAFSGYGATMIDYNFKQNAVSVGIALNDLLDR